MKIIDLLNKIANEEEVPEKIEYKKEIYNKLQNQNNSLYYYQVLGQGKFLVEQLSSVSDLLDEVKIIEEDKKIEKFEFGEIEDQEHYNIKKKINEIIDKLEEIK